METNSFDPDFVQFQQKQVEENWGNGSRAWNIFLLKKTKNPHFYQCYCHNQYQQYRAETKFGWFKYSLIIPPHFQYQKEKWLLVNGSCCSAVHNPKIKGDQIQSSLLS